MAEFIIAMGIPTTIMGLLVWWLKRYIDKRDKVAEQREKNMESLMLIILQECTANGVLSEATAKAVQRIPDARCNGDMTSALEAVAQIQKKKEKFMNDQAIQHIIHRYS